MMKLIVNDTVHCREDGGARQGRQGKQEEKREDRRTSHAGVTSKHRQRLCRPAAVSGEEDAAVIGNGEIDPSARNYAMDPARSPAVMKEDSSRLSGKRRSQQINQRGMLEGRGG
jgi:hypothetical protein